MQTCNSGGADLNLGHAFLAPGIANKSELGRHHLLVRLRWQWLAQIVDALDQQILQRQATSDPQLPPHAKSHSDKHARLVAQDHPMFDIFDADAFHHVRDSFALLAKELLADQALLLENFLVATVAKRGVDHVAERSQLGPLVLLARKDVEKHGHVLHLPLGAGNFAERTALS